MSSVAAAAVAAPQTAPAASTSAPEASGGSEPVSAAANGLDALLGDFTGAELAGPADDGSEVGEATENTEPAADKDAPKGREAPDELIFSDEQLQTPEGVKRAKARVTELRKLQHQKYLELKGYERHVGAKAEKFKAKLNGFRQEKQAFDWERNTIRSNLEGLRSSDPDTILNALGSLTNMDGFRAYEMLTSHIVNRGAPKLDPQVQAILDQQARELAELKQATTQRELAQRAQQQQGQIQNHLSNIGQMIRTSTDTPHLTRIFQDDPERLTSVIFDEIVKTNGAKPAKQLFAEMERELQAHFGGVTPQGANGGTVPKQPTSAPSSPGRSIGPSTAAVATTRAPTEQEVLRQLANDTELLASLGL